MFNLGPLLHHLIAENSPKGESDLYSVPYFTYRGTLLITDEVNIPKCYSQASAPHPLIFPEPNFLTVSQCPFVSHFRRIRCPHNPSPKGGPTIISTAEDIRVLSFIFKINYLFPQLVVV